jgi:hypothetical protein
MEKGKRAALVAVGDRGEVPEADKRAQRANRRSGT